MVQGPIFGCKLQPTLPFCLGLKQRNGAIKCRESGTWPSFPSGKALSDLFYNGNLARRSQHSNQVVACVSVIPGPIGNVSIF